jgi:hypothetical protein
MIGITETAKIGSTRDLVILMDGVTHVPHEHCVPDHSNEPTRDWHFKLGHRILPSSSPSWSIHGKISSRKYDEQLSMRIVPFTFTSFTFYAPKYTHAHTQSGSDNNTFS